MQKVEQQRRERLESMKKKKKGPMVALSTDGDDENGWSADKSPICMPRNS